MNKVSDLWNRSVEVLRAPRVRIRMYGDDEARDVYRLYTTRHHVFKFTKLKRWGVALVQLTPSFDAYLAGGRKEELRRRRKRALKSGYRLAQIPPLDYLDDLMAINRSAPIRQGRVMDASETDAARVQQSYEHIPLIYGILHADGRLRAYADVLVIGEVVVIKRLLGHADDLDAGIMYLLVSEIIRSFAHPGGPLWAEYGTFWGASPGLAAFKRRTGFRPYTVDWYWRVSPRAWGYS